MKDFEKAFEENYAKLNPEQKQAVDETEGPILVIAGPGTGKTQLLSTRIANILKKTDVLPENILAMTFTESGARNMRERLSRFIGNDSYKVGIFTYHAFSNEIIQNNREYFRERNLENLVDELKMHQILSEIHSKLPYDSNLKTVKIGSIKSAISELKRALISPQKLKKIAKQNVELDIKLHQKIKDLDFSFFSGNYGLAKKEPIYSQILFAMTEVLNEAEQIEKIKPNLYLAYEALREALEISKENKNAKALTAWKNDYFSSISQDFSHAPQSKDVMNNKRILDLADFFESYNQTLLAEDLFDYDDMILETIAALEKNDDLKLSLQEKYQYILLDEYQDTNESQSRIIELLTDNPVNEGRPNVLAVGDDDQAIYAFQGANSSNMIDFYRRYNNTLVINLTRNYRSCGEILQTAKGVAEQISDRLTKNLPIEIEKDISAEGKFSKKVNIVRQDFKSQISEYSWVSKEILRLIQSGVEPKEIAILAPKHKFLQKISPFLKRENIEISYEKKENIFEDKTVHELIQVSKLAIAISEKTDEINELFPEVLSFDFWQIPPEEVWKLSWNANDSRADFWLEKMLESENEKVQFAAKFLVQISAYAKNKPLEQMLDILLGTEEAEKNLKSPIREWIAKNDEFFYDTLANLTVLRDHLREFLKRENNSLQDLVNFEKAYSDAELKIINTNPHKTNDNAVQLMTPFQAKGLEFSHVFLISVNNSVWNSKSGGNMKITMPKNLEFVNIKDGGEDTKKRLFFVAITRAKTDLYLTNFTKDFVGKNQTPLEFMIEADGESKIIPDEFSKIEIDESEALEQKDLVTNWHEFYAPKTEKLKDLLRARLENYQISPTHVNDFVNMEYEGKGPQGFFENSILRFPGRYSPSAALGSLVHAGMNEIQDLKNAGVDAELDKILSKIYKKVDEMSFSQEEKEEVKLRAERIMNYVFENRKSVFVAGNIAEKNFRNAGVKIGDAWLTGKIDLIQIDKDLKEITVLDFKTGSIPLAKNGKINKSDGKIHRYEQQLYFYKFLIEGCSEFAGYKVSKGVLEFIEPKNGGSGALYEIEFESAKEDKLKLLIQAIFGRIKTFDFSVDDKLSKDVGGTRKFEDKLIEEFKIKYGIE